MYDGWKRVNAGNKKKERGHTELLIDFFEARALVVTAIEATIGFFVVAKVDGDVCVDEVAEEDHKLGVEVASEKVKAKYFVAV
jgi:hypothetical protein